MVTVVLPQPLPVPPSSTLGADVSTASLPFTHTISDYILAAPPPFVNGGVQMSIGKCNKTKKYF